MNLMIFVVNISGNIGNSEEKTEDYLQYLNKLGFREITADVTLAIINDRKNQNQAQELIKFLTKP